MNPGRAYFFCGIIFAGLFFSGSRPAHADVDLLADDLTDMNDIVLETPGGIGWKKHKWEFGVNAAFTQLVDKHDMSVTVDNDAIGHGELLEEFEENGLVPPGAGTSIVSASPKNSYEFGAYVLYEVVPWVSVGVDSGFGISQDGTIISNGIYAAPLFEAQFSREIYHATPVIRLGGWIGRFRPYGIAGLGWYSVRQRLAINITDPFDPEGEPAPIGVYDQQDSYLGSNFGGGIDFRLSQRGSAGFELLYHRIYNPGGNISFFAPGFHLTFLF